MSKIHCPSGKHEDKTPSCMVYPDGSAWCFACSTYFRSVDGVPVPTAKPKENIVDAIEYISGLSIINHRGFDFPHDYRGYYIVWPDKSYYKRRNWASDSHGTKYSNPVGHSQPWFELLSPNSHTCVIVEGEINALSIKKVYPDVDVISFGGVGNFTSHITRNNLIKLAKYSNVVIVADNDIAGLRAAIKLKELLLTHVTDISIILLEQDANQLYEHGKEALKKELGDLGL